MDEKKDQELPALSTALLPPNPDNPETQVLELDELWSFVLTKACEVWVWIALCRYTRQVVAFALGDRSEQTCRRLWNVIPLMYRSGTCFSDFWQAYQAVEALASAVKP